MYWNSSYPPFHNAFHYISFFSCLLRFSLRIYLDILQYSLQIAKKTSKGFRAQWRTVCLELATSAESLWTPLQLWPRYMLHLEWHFVTGLVNGEAVYRTLDEMLCFLYFLDTEKQTAQKNRLFETRWFWLERNRVHGFMFKYERNTAYKIRTKMQWQVKTTFLTLWQRNNYGLALTK
jgi:hypothetical protein